MGWNIHETHYQPDLTENMLERYPSLELLYSNEWYGYYISKNIKVEKAYVLYANAAYFKTVQGCVASIKAVSDLPIFVYLMNFNAKLKELKLFIGIVILRKIFNLIILIGLILIFIIFLYKDLKLLNIVC
jgi:hypothetical protein